VAEIVTKLFVQCANDARWQASATLPSGDGRQNLDSRNRGQVHLIAGARIDLHSHLCRSGLGNVSFDYHAAIAKKSASTYRRSPRRFASTSRRSGNLQPAT
jgi:hypothetical protein